MSYRIVISSFAAVAIGMSCIATDASARGGGGGGGGFRGGGSAAIGGGGFRSGVTGPTGGGGYFAAPGVRRIPRITGVGPAPSNPRHFHRLTGVGDPTAGGAAGDRGLIAGVGGPTGGGAAGATGGGVAAGALYYAPASYDSNAACGRYPYPPCNRVPTR
jgi:hypothetical protein